MTTPEQNPTITVKSIDNIFVAYIRFVGQTSDIPTHFARLREQVGEHIIGDPICLYDVTANKNPQENHIEICYPVDQPAKDLAHTNAVQPDC